MTISQKIKMALAYKGMSEAELARSVGSSPQAFNQRMKTGKFSSDEMSKIAEALGAKPASVRARLSRGRKQLKRLLTEREEEM